MALSIEFPDQHREAVWRAKAAAQGLTLEAWFKKLADESAGTEAIAEANREKKQAAAARILELQKHVKPDPEGWTIRDYLAHGRR